MNKKRKKKSLNKFLIAVISLILLIIVIFSSPIFQIKAINFEGGQKYSKADILSEIKIDVGSNIFMVRVNNSKKILQSKPYIKSVDINIKYPSILNINIKERKARGYVSYNDGTGETYLYIDEYGRVLEANKTFKEQLPIVEGLRFDNFCVGEILEVKNTQSFDVVVKTAAILAKYENEYEAIGDIAKIDVNDPENIHMYIKNIDVLLGDLTDYDFKIRKTLTIVKDIPYENRGFLDVTNPNQESIFEFLK